MNANLLFENSYLDDLLEADWHWFCHDWDYWVNYVLRQPSLADEGRQDNTHPKENKNAPEIS